MSGVTIITAPRILTADGIGTVAGWMAVGGGRIESIGKGDPPDGASSVDLEGVVVPGFIDAHARLTDAGLLALGPDLGTAASIPEALDLLRSYLKDSRTEWVVMEAPGPSRGGLPDRRQLDELARFRCLFVTAPGGGESSLSSAGLAKLELDLEIDGIEMDLRGQPTGRLSGAADREARRLLLERIPEPALRDAQIAACKKALEHGITAVHDAGGSGMEARELGVLLQSKGSFPVDVTVYPAPADPQKAAELGFSRAGARLQPGDAPMDDSSLSALFASAASLGIQVSIEASGEPAIERVLACLEGAGGLAPGSPALRHRIEGCQEMALDQMARAAALGVVAVVHPGDGVPLGAMVEAGLRPAGGTWAPSHPMDPIAQMREACSHTQAGQGLAAEQALLMYTAWAARAAGQEQDRGSLAEGKVADFCVLSADPSEPGAEVLSTWVGGNRLWGRIGQEGVSLPGFSWVRGQGELPRELF